MPGDRLKTDMYLAAVERAVAEPGRWIDIPRRFDRELVASILGGCLRRGYLRAPPRDGDATIVVDGNSYIRTASPVTSRVAEVDGGWSLSIRVED
jgi:hypothetical protein